MSLMHGLPAMLRFLLGRLGMFRAMVMTTLLTMAMSVAITVVLMRLLDLPKLGDGMAIAAFCPFVIVPFMTRFYLRMIEQLDQTNGELQAALTEVRELRGMLPICSSCKRIRDDGGYWTHIESYISRHSRAEFTHSMCPQCNEQLYGDLLRAKGR